MLENFTIIILANYEDEERCQKVIEGLPHADKFAKFIITN